MCTRCLLRDMIEAGDSMEMIEKYRAAIKAADRVTEEVYESRLAVCQDCEKLNAGTCIAAAMWSCAQWQPCHGARRRSGSHSRAALSEEAVAAAQP